METLGPEIEKCPNDCLTKCKQEIPSPQNDKFCGSKKHDPITEQCCFNEKVCPINAICVMNINGRADCLGKNDKQCRDRNICRDGKECYEKLAITDQGYEILSECQNPDEKRSCGGTPDCKSPNICMIKEGKEQCITKAKFIQQIPKESQSQLETPIEPISQETPDSDNCPKGQKCSWWDSINPINIFK